MSPDLALCQSFADAHPTDAARVLEQVPAAEAAPLLDAMPSSTLARVFDRMTPAAAADCLVQMRRERAAALLVALRTDRAAALLRQIGAPGREPLLGGMPPAERAHLARALHYPEGSAGALMDPRVMAVADDITAREALARIRHAPGHLLAYVYVIDRARRLVGVVDLRELMLARPADGMTTVMRAPVASVSAHATPSGILSHPAWALVHALPVVDEGALVGAIRYQTFRQLEDAARHQPAAAGGVATVFALGELYWLSLSSLIEGMAAVATSGRVPAGRPGGDAHGRD